MLSAKLYEDRLIFIDNEEIEFPKTQYLHEIVTPYGMDKLCFVTGGEPSHNFELASRNIKNLTIKKSKEFNIPDLLRSDYVIMTKQGLIELENIIEGRHANYFRNKKVPTEEGLQRQITRKQDKYVAEII